MSCSATETHHPIRSDVAVPIAVGEVPDRSRWAWPAITVFAAVLAFAAHFRPWQGGLFEDWGWAWLVKSAGFTGAIAAEWPNWVGRPLSIFPISIGMLISGGGFVGPFFLLGITAVLQLLCSLWALKFIVGNRAIRMGLAILIAFHPWWPAGLTLRFLAPQMSILAAIIYFGCVDRFLRVGKKRWLVGVGLLPIVCLFLYQAPVLALLIGVVALSVTANCQLARKGVATLVTLAAIIFATAWTLVIAPIISPLAYEASKRDEILDPVEIFHTIVHGLVRSLPSLFFAAIALLLVAVALMYTRRMSLRSGLALIGLIFAAPFASIVFATSLVSLQDPERFAIPVSLSLWFLAAALGGYAQLNLVTQRLLLAGAVTVSVIGAVVGILMWTNYTMMQQRLIATVVSVRSQVPAGQEIVVEDFSGQYGGLYTLFPHVLDIAVRVEQGQGAPATICTPDETERIAREIATQACSVLVADDPLQVLGEFDLDGRHVRIVTIPQPAPPG